MALSPAEWGDEDGDDEIYFFFTEISRAFDSYERVKVPRVARVCAVSPWSQLSALFSALLGLPSFPPASVFVSLFHLLFCWAFTTFLAA